jgi:hypothetical protein
MDLETMPGASAYFRARSGLRNIRQRCRAMIFTLLLLLTQTHADDRPLKGKHMDPQFAVLPYPAAQVADARLSQAGSAGLMLSQYQTPSGIKLVWLPTLSAQPGSATMSPLSVASFTDRPGWDVIPAKSANWHIVSFQAGSARAPLVVHTTGAAEQTRVDPRNSRGVFMFPRFVRGSGPHPDITAVELDADYRITLYLALPDGSYGPRQALEAPVPGILQDVRMLELKDGYLLFAQRFQPGEQRQYLVDGEPEIMRSGVLEVRRLDRSFKPVGPVWRPFGDQAVYQFDADASSDGQVAVFSSGSSGWQLVLMRHASVGPVEPSRFEGKTAAPLSSPSVLFAGSDLLLSVLADGGTERARLWVAKWKRSP